MSFADLSPFFLMTFLKNDLNVKDFCKLNSAFCNKVDRPHLQHCLKLECKRYSLNQNRHSVKFAYLKVKSEKLNSSEEMLVFNFDSNRTMAQKWETLEETTVMTDITGIGASTTVSQLSLSVVKVGHTFILWNECGIALNKDVNHYTTNEHTIGKTIYSVGSMAGGTFERDENKEVEIDFKKLSNDTYKGDSESVYRGYVRNDFMSGKGVMKYQDGSVYVGNWKDDQRQGKGELLTCKGETYSGSWFKDELIIAQIQYMNGDVYTGGFKNSAPIGRGKVTRANGKVEWYNSWGVK